MLLSAMLLSAMLSTIVMVAHPRAVKLLVSWPVERSNLGGELVWMGVETGVFASRIAHKLSSVPASASVPLLHARATLTGGLCALGCVLWLVWVGVCAVACVARVVCRGLCGFGLCTVGCVVWAVCCGLCGLGCALWPVCGWGVCVVCVV